MFPVLWLEFLSCGRLLCWQLLWVEFHCWFLFLGCCETLLPLFQLLVVSLFLPLVLLKYWLFFLGQLLFRHLFDGCLDFLRLWAWFVDGLGAVSSKLVIFSLLHLNFSNQLFFTSYMFWDFSSCFLQSLLQSSWSCWRMWTEEIVYISLSILLSFSLNFALLRSATTWWSLACALIFSNESASFIFFFCSSGLLGNCPCKTNQHKWHECSYFSACSKRLAFSGSNYYAISCSCSSEF